MELPRPFLVMATQNPVERESTFMLPAAQMDRFFICLSMGYPDAEEEVRILETLGDGTDYGCVQAVTAPEVLMGLREEIKQVKVSEFCSRYMVELVQKTRENPWLKQGGSPRASRSLYQGSKAWAAMRGRDYVVPEDVKDIWMAVMVHRVVLSGEARYQKKTAEMILEEILNGTEVPPRGKDLFDGNKAE